jgi:hypothetical protein
MGGPHQLVKGLKRIKALVSPSLQVSAFKLKLYYCLSWVYRLLAHPADLGVPVLNDEMNQFPKTAMFFFYGEP